MNQAAGKLPLLFAALVLLSCPLSRPPGGTPDPEAHAGPGSSPAPSLLDLLDKAAAVPAPPGRIRPTFEVERRQPAGPRCERPSIYCIDDYLEAAAPARPGGDCEQQALAAVRAARLAPPAAPAEPRAPEALALRLEELLGLSPVIEALERRPVRVRLLSSEVGSVASTATLELHHPSLGTFRARLLLPRASNRAALVVLPGHPEPSGDDPASEFLDLFGGRQLYAARYTLLILEPRGYDSGQAEHDASVALACQGRPLAGFRAAEAMVLLSLLRRLQAIGQTGPVGAMGHSGGSILGSVLYRLDPHLAFWIVDAASDYLATTPCDHQPGTCILDETVPALHPMAGLLGAPDRPQGGAPVLVQPYGYSPGMTEVRSFLATFRASAEAVPAG
jgi:hypothetical protein